MKPLEIARKYFDFLAQGEFEQLMSLLDDEIVWNQPGESDLSGRYQGKEKIQRLFGEFISRSQGTFKIDRVDRLMQNNEQVIAQIAFSANRSGQELSMSGIDLFRIQNGKIVEVTLFSENQPIEDRFWNI